MTEAMRDRGALERLSRHRKSYVAWEEGKPPDALIERMRLG